MLKTATTIRRTVLSIRTFSSVTENKTLSFVQRNPLLRQVHARDPSDNFYPKVKAPIEIETAEDLDQIVK